MAKKKYSREGASLETLLDLNGEIFPMDNGYWTKFEASRVTPTAQIPHGIKYSLTLHDRNNTRVLGFDNAHAFKSKKIGTQLVKSPGIINTKWKRFVLTNSNQRAGSLRIFGKTLRQY